MYLAHPRTASQATAVALMSIGFKKVSHHLRLWEVGADIVTRENRDEWLVFTTVRNHFDALVSWVCKRYKRRTYTPWDLQAFETALAGNMWVEKNRMWHLHSDDANVVMRYESLESDLAAVLSLKGLDIPRLSKKNVSAERHGRPYQEFYVEATRRYVEERFRHEIERFRYQF